MKIIATVEARISSSRLHGKVLRPILGKPMLELLIERVKRVKKIDQIVIATSTQREDDSIEELADKLKIGCYRGSLEDVLRRVLNAAISYGADLIVKLSGDNPLYDWIMIDAIVEFYLQNDYDFVSSTAMGFSESWKAQRTFPLGTGISVFSAEFLKDIEAVTRENPYDREHVISYITQHPDKFRLGAFQATGKLAAYNRPELRFTVDRKEDLFLIKKIFENLYVQNPAFATADAISFLDRNPELKLVNKKIRQKALKK